MNGAATVSPLQVPNLCQCGHDLIAHNLAANPQTCLLCLRFGGVNNPHPFTSDNEISPALAFPQTLPARFVAAGGFGYGFTLIAAAATKGSNVVNIVGPTTLIQPGMTFTTVAQANPANSASYTVVSVSGGFITITPVLQNNLAANTPLLFQGADGSTMGPGLPPNGQRAG